VDQQGDWMMNYTNEVVSAAIPKNVDRSKVLDILIGVFAIEDHQRVRHEKGLQQLQGKLASTVPARILIAEDNPVNQKLAQNIFEGLGYKPVIVSNGREVIDRLRKEVFDVIFMDVQMPELDGLETTRFVLEKMALTKRPYIIAMTAFALEGDKEKCLEAGMDDYISKPFMVEEIVEQLQKWSKDSLSSPDMNVEQEKIPVTDQEVKEVSVKATEVAVEVQPVLNPDSIERLRQMTMGSDPDFFRKVVEMFIEQAELIGEEIEEQLRYLNLKDLATSAHKLKGSALNMGALRLADACKAIEVKAKSGEQDGLLELVEAFRTAAAATTMALKGLF
jgi:CheY-like chemotaxis protein/HPt (histidine-containing phosphotransfer) domain-containing protein